VTVGELKEECERVRKQGLKFMVLRIDRHGGAWMQITKGLLGNVVGSDKHGSFVSVEIAKVEAKIAEMDPSTEIPKVRPHRAKVILP
jgi:hypothetical protein